MGFPALYMTVTAPRLRCWFADAGLATYSDMVGRAENDLLGRRRPDRRCRHRLWRPERAGGSGQYRASGYEAAGVAAIQIEDQRCPRSAAISPGRRVVPAEDCWCFKIMLPSKRAVMASIHIRHRRTDARIGASARRESCVAPALYEEAGADVIRRIVRKRGRARTDRQGSEAAARQHGREDAASRPRGSSSRLRPAIASWARIQRRRRGNAHGVGPSQASRAPASA